MIATFALVCEAKGLTCVAVQKPLNHSFMRYAEAVGKSSLTWVPIEGGKWRKRFQRSRDVADLLGVANERPVA